MNTTYRHWTLSRQADGIAWATLDREGNGEKCATNALSAAVMAELASLLDELDRQPPKGLIFCSAKSAGFIAGADIDEFSTLDTPAKGKALVERGWHLFNRLAAVRYPTLALVNGHCLGGGLELALACRYRVAVESDANEGETKARFGLPEVLLGIFPGWGGMLRLPALIGPQVALDMMLTGKAVDGKKAKRLGLVDAVVPPRIARQAASSMVLSGAPGHQAGGLPALLNTPLLRGLIAGQARKQVAKRASRQHYPAPYAIIDIWAKHHGNALADSSLIDGIIGSPTAKNLLRVFRLQERLKSFGKEADFKAKRVHVVGAGVMGGDIAAWCALRGLTVTLQDQSLERVAAAIGRAKTLFERRLKDRLPVRAALDRLIPDIAGHGAAQADVVIEAIFEDVAAKRSLLQALEAKMKPEAVLATNTSSLKLEDLRGDLQTPTRLVGIHFFNPVPSMMLVEVVRPEGGDEATVQRACAFVRQIDKLPLPVNSAPGFLVNAVLAPYMLAAMRAVDEGIAPATIDRALRDFGMPLGPIELADTVGLDIALAAGQQLADGATPPRCLRERVERGELGKKSGRGFYSYSNGRAQQGAPGQIPAGLAERLVQPLLDRAAALVAAGIVADTDLADAGVIFGTGFAPFTGGPLHYAARLAEGGGKHSKQDRRTIKN